MKRKLPFLLLIITATSLAQSPPSDTTQSTAPPSDIASPPPRDPPQKTLEFPLGEGVGRGDAITIPVTIAGKVHLLFVDTGAALSMIDPTLEPTLKESLGNRIGTFKATAFNGEKVDMPLYRAPVFNIGAQRLKHVGGYVATKDLQPFREAIGRPVEGILGLDVLSQYVLRLDFRRHVFELIDPEAFQPPKDDSAVAFPLIVTPTGVPAITIPFAGIPDLEVNIDTGDGGPGSIARDTLKKIPAAEMTAGTSHGTQDAAGNAQAKETIIKRKWSIGKTAFDDVPLQVAAFNVIGLHALADFVVTFDFQRKTLYLESLRPRHPAELPQLQFGLALKDGRFIVYNLNETAKGLDIQVSDQLVAVDGKDISKMELWALREQLQKNKSPTIRLQRKSQTHDVTLHHE